jgi:transposase
MSQGVLIVGAGERRRRFILVYNPEEAHLDGKYIISSSDDTLSAGDIALGYKQLMEVERAFRTLKTTLDLSPVYHRKDERIQAHVFLCFLALLLVRIAERKTGMTWDRIKDQMERLHLGEFFQKMDVFYKRRNRRRNRSTS